MLKIKLISVVAFATLISSPILAVAEEGASQISYSAKKQGRVGFQKQDEASVTLNKAHKVTDVPHPADIEPAAGASEAQTSRQDDVAKSIKLPRKN